MTLSLYNYNIEPVYDIHNIRKDVQYVVCNFISSLMNNYLISLISSYYSIYKRNIKINFQKSNICEIFHHILCRKMFN